MSHEVSKEITEIPIEYDGKKVIYKMRRVNFDDYWSIINQTQSMQNDAEGNPVMRVDQTMRNKIFLSKSIVDPVMTIETVSILPTPVGAILLNCFNKLNDTDPELLKKTLATLKL